MARISFLLIAHTLRNRFPNHKQRAEQLAASALEAELERWRRLDWKVTSFLSLVGRPLLPLWRCWRPANVVLAEDPVWKDRD